MIAFEKERADKLNWLRSLKPGDVVAWLRGNLSTPCALTVHRVTPTQIIVEDGRDPLRFSRTDGWLRGGRSRIEPMTKELEEKIERQQLEQWLGNIAYRPSDIQKISTACLREMRGVYDRHHPKAAK